MLLLVVMVMVIVVVVQRILLALVVKNVGARPIHKNKKGAIYFAAEQLRAAALSC